MFRIAGGLLLLALGGWLFLRTNWDQPVAGIIGHQLAVLVFVLPGLGLFWWLWNEKQQHTGGWGRKVDPYAGWKPPRR